MRGMCIRSLVGELRSHMPRVAKKPNHKNISNTVTNSINTVTMAHIKKNLKSTELTYNELK